MGRLSGWNGSQSGCGITLDSERQHRTKGSFAKAQVSLGSAHRQATDASTNAGLAFSGPWCLKSPSLFLSCPLATAFSWLDPHFTNNGGCMGDGVTFLLHLTHAKLLDQGGCLFLSHQPCMARLISCQFVPFKVFWLTVSQHAAAAW